MRAVLWKSQRLHSAEHCTVSKHGKGHRLAGIVVLPIDSRPGHISYVIDVDDAWRSQSAELSVVAGETRRRMRLALASPGRWKIDGSSQGRFDGCIDIDLGFSPATNTLPIRRLRLDVGGIAQLTAVWVRFPELSVEPLQQTYERIGETKWRYRSGTFAAELEVDSDGIVTRYGDDVWKAIAASPDQRLFS